MFLNPSALHYQYGALEQGANKADIKRAANYLDDAVNCSDPDFSENSALSLQVKYSVFFRTLCHASIFTLLFTSLLHPPHLPVHTSIALVAVDVIAVGVLLVNAVANQSLFGVSRVAGDYIALVLCIADLLLQIFCSSSILCICRLYFLINFSDSTRNSFFCAIGTLPRVAIVLLLLLLFIFFFSCAAVLLYGRHEEDFHNLQSSVISLYQLSTTVNNPDLWLPLYAWNRINAIPFIAYFAVIIVVLQNLFVVIVFERYQNSFESIFLRRKDNQRRSVKKAFRCLDVNQRGRVEVAVIYDLLRYLRPHYNNDKIQLIYEVIDLEKIYQDITLEQFRRIVPALHLSIRSTYTDVTTNSHANERFAWRAYYAVMCVANFTVVASVTYLGISFITEDNFAPILILLGILVVLAGIGVAGVGMSMGWRYVYSRHWTFLATCTFLTSLVAYICAVVFALTSWQNNAIKYDYMISAIAIVLLGRCIDTLQILYYIPYFSTIVQSVREIAPGVPVHCVTLFVVFYVFAYVGMLWFGGIITKDTKFHFASTEYYYLNTFDSFPEAFVTLFNCMVVNNWNLIASGYVNETGSNMCYIFFACFNMLAVLFCLSTITSFFITASMTKLKLHEECLHVMPESQSVFSAETEDIQAPPLPQYSTPIKPPADNVSQHSSPDKRFRLRERGFDPDALFESMRNVGTSDFHATLTLLASGIGVNILVTKNDVILYQSPRFHDTLSKYHVDGGVGILAEIEKELHETHPAPGTPNVVAPPVEVQKYYSKITSPETDVGILGSTQSTLDIRCLSTSMKLDADSLHVTTIYIAREKSSAQL